MNSNELKSYSYYLTLNSNQLKHQLKLAQILAAKGLQSLSAMLLEVHIRAKFHENSHTKSVGFRTESTAITTNSTQ